MTTCLILAAGDAERHNGGNKALLEVNGEALIDRMLWQTKGWNTRIVTHREDLKRNGSITFNPDGRRWVVETLLSTVGFWGSKNDVVVLLCDVFYTDAAMDKLRDFNGTAAFGEGCNIHALKWRSEFSCPIADFLLKSVRNAEKHPRMHGAGKLWLFVQCAGLPVTDFGDETRDFDSPQEHQRFIEKYGNRSTK